MNKKGLSQVVSTILIILLTISAVGIVWVGINTFIQKQVNNKCVNVYESIKFNKDYLCYDNVNHKMIFSIDRGETELNEIMVSIMLDASSVSYKLLSTPTLAYSTNLPTSQLTNFNTTQEVAIPGSEEGRTYCASEILEKPESIWIAPIIEKQACDSIQVNSIPVCTGLTCP